MWRNTYKDYKTDTPWIQEPLEPGKGIIGCEMHELNGWGEAKHDIRPQKPGWIRSLLNSLFKRDDKQTSMDI